MGIASSTIPNFSKILINMFYDSINIFYAHGLLSDPDFIALIKFIAFAATVELSLPPTYTV